MSNYMVNSFRSLDLPDFAWRTDREGVTMALAGPPNATKTRKRPLPGINNLGRVFNGEFPVTVHEMGR
jgi:hypothetical protein